MNSKLIIYSLCCILAILYLVQQYYYTPLIPFGDDLPTIVDLLFKFENAPLLSEKLAVIYNNHFLEHRLLTSSVISVIMYWITGTIHFPAFTLIAGLFWVSLLLFYREFLKKLSLSSGWLLTITFVLLSSASYQAMYWPMAALQHFLVIFLVVVAINLLCSEGNIVNFLPAVFVAFLATFTSGNGLAVWPSSLLILLIRKQYKFSLYWSIYTILALSFYFWRFPFPGSSLTSSTQVLFAHSFSKFISFLAGLGAVVKLEGSPYFLDSDNAPFSFRYPAIYVGLSIVVTFVWMLRQAVFKYDLKTLPLLGISSFVFISFALIVLGRFSDSTTITVFKSRYCPYSLVAVSNTICLLAFASKNEGWHPWLQRVSIVLGLAFWSAWQLIAYHKIINHSNMLQAGFFNWQHNKKWIIYQSTAFYEGYYNDLFNKMKATGFPYQTPLTSLTTAFNHKQSTTVGFSTITDLTLIKKNGKVEIYARNEHAEPLKSTNQGYAIIMASKKDTFLIWSVVNRTTLRNFLYNDQLCGVGYKVEAILDTQQMPKGIYSLHQFRYSNGKGFIDSNHLKTLSL